MTRGTRRLVQIGYWLSILAGLAVVLAANPKWI